MLMNYEQMILKQNFINTSKTYTRKRLAQKIKRSAINVIFTCKYFLKIGFEDADRINVALDTDRGGLLRARQSNFRFRKR